MVRSLYDSRPSRPKKGFFSICTGGNGTKSSISRGPKLHFTPTTTHITRAMVGAGSSAAPAAPPKPVATPMQPNMSASSDINRKMQSLVLDTGKTVYTHADAESLKKRLRAEGIPAVVTVGTQDMRTGKVTTNPSWQNNMADDLAHAYDQLSVKLSDLEMFACRIDLQALHAFRKTEEKVNAIDKSFHTLAAENMMLTRQNKELSDCLSKMDQKMLELEVRMLGSLTSFNDDISSLRTSSQTLAVETTRLRKMMDTDQTTSKSFEEAVYTPPNSPRCKKRLEDEFSIAPKLRPLPPDENIDESPLCLDFCVSMA